MAQWFKRLFFLILPDFLPKIIFYSVIVYILIGKPKFLKKVYNKAMLKKSEWIGVVVWKEK